MEEQGEQGEREREIVSNLTYDRALQEKQASGEVGKLLDEKKLIAEIGKLTSNKKLYKYVFNPPVTSPRLLSPLPSPSLVNNSLQHFINVNCRTYSELNESIKQYETQITTLRAELDVSTSPLPLSSLPASSHLFILSLLLPFTLLTSQKCRKSKMSEMHIEMRGRRSMTQSTRAGTNMPPTHPRSKRL